MTTGNKRQCKRQITERPIPNLSQNSEKRWFVAAIGRDPSFKYGKGQSGAVSAFAILMAPVNFNELVQIEGQVLGNKLSPFQYIRRRLGPLPK